MVMVKPAISKFNNQFSYKNRVEMQPQSPYPTGYFPASQPRKSNAWKWILGICITLFLLCGGGLVACVALIGTTASSIEEEQKSKSGDVVLSKCEVTLVGLIPNARITYEVTNSSDKVRTYFVDFSASQPNGARYGNTTDIVTDVRPGQTAVEEAFIVLADGATTATCSIDNVS